MAAKTVRRSGNGNGRIHRRRQDRPADLGKPDQERLSRARLSPWFTGRLREAEALAAESQEKLKKYNDTLREARTAGYKLLEKERAEGLKDKEQKLRQSRDELSNEVSAQVDQIRKQEQSVKSELEGQAATIGNLISSQILRRPAR